MRTAHYIRYESGDRWRVAIVETLDAKNALTTAFEADGTSYDYHGKVQIPDVDAGMVEQHL